MAEIRFWSAMADEFLRLVDLEQVVAAAAVVALVAVVVVVADVPAVAGVKFADCLAKTAVAEGCVAATMYDVSGMETAAATAAASRADQVLAAGVQVRMQDS